MLYTSLAEKAHGAFALCVRFPVKVFSITMCLQFIALTEFDPQVNSYVCVTIDTLWTNELDRDMQLIFFDTLFLFQLSSTFSTD